jgi:hypothetical protein
MPYYTPYYCGYCPHRLSDPEPPPYGADGGWGEGPVPGHADGAADDAQRRYGTYTAVLRDDSNYWNMGGNGLVPYGTPRPARTGPPDLVDMIQVSRENGCGPYPPSDAATLGAPVSTGEDGTAPAGKPDEKKGSKETPPVGRPVPLE